jgi:hypothetical protein
MQNYVFHLFLNRNLAPTGKAHRKAQCLLAPRFNVGWVRALS